MAVTPSSPTSLSNDREFEELYRHYSQRVFRYLCRLGVDEGRAAEIRQEVFLKAYLHGIASRSEAEAGAWLFHVAQNGAVSSFRKREVRTRHQDTAQEAEISWQSGVPAPDAIHMAAEERREVFEEIRTLPRMMRHCLVLRYVQELSVAEVADLLGLSPNTVKTHIKNGRRALKNRLGPDKETL